MQDSALRELFKQVVPAVDFACLRYHRDRDERVTVREDILQPLDTSRDEGAMVIVHHRGGMGYAATPDLTATGLKNAFAKAAQWAERSARFAVVDFSSIAMPHPKGEFRSPVQVAWNDWTLADKIARLMAMSKSMKISPKIVDWSASLWHARSERIYLTNGGGEVYQDFNRLVPDLGATANEGAETVSRTFGMAHVRQVGMELLTSTGLESITRSLAEDALELLAAPNCPIGVRDVILAPDQMVLQIHESIGHPLELDRILGDERNYAGTSFVTPDMFGAYQYGSSLLNVTYDPKRAFQAASFAFDDEGSAAERAYVIKDGILLRPIGGGVSQARGKMAGVAASRADSWRRPPIDRMANLNVEPGRDSLQAMIANCERGIYLKTNCSWSIDDSRNKFQFGCEWGRLIENGRLTQVVKKPNYRGISANFWRSLKAVGGENEFEVLGTPYCGKGEPNQSVFVGHASPPCLFGQVDVFGGV